MTNTETTKSYWLLVTFISNVPQAGCVHISANNPEEAEAVLRATLGDDVSQLFIESISTEPPADLIESVTAEAPTQVN